MNSTAYAKATGLLQSRAVCAAIEIEALARNFPMDAWAKEDLLRVANSLRTSEREAEAIVSEYERGEAA